jgi:hypothetical protein
MKIETLKEIANDINIVTSDNFVEIMESLPNKNYGRLMNELDRVGDSDTADEYTLWGQRFNGANQNGDIVTVSNDVVEIIFDYVHKETRVFFLNNFEPKWLNWNWILQNVEDNAIKDIEINHY